MAESVNIVTHLQAAEYKAWWCNSEFGKFTQEADVPDFGFNIHLILHHEHLHVSTWKLLQRQPCFWSGD